MDRAATYYRTLWASCSRDEKLVLIQLAQEELVNPKAKAAIWQLMKKHLVVRDPVFQIMNESFKQFASSAVPLSTVEKWEKEDATVRWDTVLLTVAIGVAAFLIITQQAFFETWMGYLTGLAAAIPAIIQVFRNFWSGSPGPAPETQSSAQ